MRMMQWSYQAFKGKVADAELPPLDIITRLGDADVFKDLLTKAGFSEVTISQETLNYRFDSFEHYWDMVESSDILKAQFEALPDDLRGQVKDEVASFAQEFSHDGELHVPHDYLLASGSK